MKRHSFYRLLIVLLGLFMACTSTKDVVPNKKVVKRPKKEYLIDENFTIYPDKVIQGDDKKAWVVSPTEIKSTYYRTEKSWKLKEDISGMPTLSAPGFPMLEALYNMALEETKLDILEKSQAFMAGKKWKGIWTRDISYSIHLALAMVEPEISINSLMFKVNKQDLVIQDTGTGGSWPVSTDRVVWSLAAWEIYKVTGDRDWLEYSFKVLKNSAERDNRTALDPESGLFYGELSFMDWREQSYPKWMGPTDIYESKALSTNVAHYSTRKILSLMAQELELSVDEIDKWDNEAEALKEQINSELWIEDLGYYSAYQYSNIMGGQLTDMTDTLGETLAVIEGVTDTSRGDKLIENLPVVQFGAPSLYPQLRGVKPYHNRGIWPFVTAYYTWAGAKTRNMEAVEFGINSLTRASALFLSHYENMVYDNGHNSGTEINSERQLWSVAGYLSLVYRDFFGMNWTTSGLELNPMVPKLIEGGLNLKNFKLRNAILDISLLGHGDEIEHISLDGEFYSGNVIPYNLTGEHKIEIHLVKSDSVDKINITKTGIQGAKVPALKLNSDDGNVNLSWKPVSGGVTYGIYRNAELIGKTDKLEYSESVVKGELSSYCIVAFTIDNVASPFSNYLLVDGSGYNKTIAVETGVYPEGREIKNSRSKRTFDNYISIIKEENESIKIGFNIEASGQYYLRFDYMNDNGHVSTENRCAIRSADLNGEFIGKFIFPQRGGMSKKLGYSNSIKVYLNKGKHTLNLFFAQDDDNMNIEINQAELASLKIIMVK